jgi:hypothetical protein
MKRPAELTGTMMLTALGDGCSAPPVEGKLSAYALSAPVDGAKIRKIVRRVTESRP